LMTIVFGALSCGTSAINLWTILHLQPGILADRELLIWRASLAVENVLSLLMIIGALRLLTRPDASGLLLPLVAWSWIVSTMLASLAGAIAVDYRRAQIATSLLHDAIRCALPMLVILLIRQRKMDGGIVPVRSTQDQA